MTLRDEKTPPPARIFDLVWSTLADLLGSAAAATLIRHCVQRAGPRAPELERLSVTKDRFDYRYDVPASWKVSGASFEALREVTRELRPLLVELTGSVVLNRLRNIPEIESCGLFDEGGDP